MKLIAAVVLALAAIAVAAPVDTTPATILRSEYNHALEGPYNFIYEISDGSQRQEEGTLKEVLNEENKPQNVVVVRGSYTYTDKDGKVETINYFADETGYHPEGESIPKIVSRR